MRTAVLTLMMAALVSAQPVQAQTRSQQAVVSKVASAQAQSSGVRTPSPVNKPAEGMDGPRGGQMLLILPLIAILGVVGAAAGGGGGGSTTPPPTSGG